MIQNAKEFAETHNLDYQISYHFLKLMEKIGKVKLHSMRKAAGGGRGRSSSVYEIPDTLNINFSEDFKIV